MPELELSDQFDDRFQLKPKDQQVAILKTLKLLGDNPRHPGLRVKRIKTKPGVFEARINRADRLSFHWDSGRIVLRTNCHHDDVLSRP